MEKKRMDPELMARYLTELIRTKEEQGEITATVDIALLKVILSLLEEKR